MSAADWTLDAELPEWLAIPASPADVGSWRADVTEIFEFLTGVDAQLTGGTLLAEPLDVPTALDTLLEFAAALPPEQRLVAGLGVPGRWPLPVIVSVGTASDGDGDDDDLLSAAGARGGLPVEQPTVEYLPDELGDGIRVTRFDLDDDGAVWATVSCARRGDGVDTVLTWRTTELELVPLFSPQLESLLALVVITPATKASA